METIKDETIPHIPDAELNVMLALWNSEKPMLIAEIAREISKSYPCTKASVHILVDRLSKRGLVKIHRVEGPVVYKLVSPTVSVKDYRAAEGKRIVDKLYGGSWKTLLSSLIDADAIAANELDKVKSILKTED